MICGGNDAEPASEVPAGGYDWTWEDTNDQDGNASNQSSWLDQFDQLFYGTGSTKEDGAGQQEDALFVNGNDCDGGESAYVDQEECAFIGQDESAYVNQEESAYVNQEESAYVNQGESAYVTQDETTFIDQTGEVLVEQTNTAMDPNESGTTLHQPYPAYHGYDQLQPAPSMPYDYEYVVPVEQPAGVAAEQATDLFNTEQCIHTYNVVNTVEEIHTPEDILLNQSHLMCVAGEITEYEESYLQQLILQKDPSVKEALRRYSLCVF